MKEKLKDYHEALLKDLSELIQIPTLYDEASVTDTMPYGEKVHRGYLWMKEKALKDGFEVMEYDGQALAIRIPGSAAEERIDVACHIDVVEPGTGWRDDPFSGFIQDGRLYGRGTQDMKGTLLLNYYALKFIKEQHLPYKKELRVVIGCDEERTMNDMKYYVQKAGEPAFAYTPDGKFPFSLGEKGALMWALEGPVETCISELDGGVQCNVISPSANALIDDIGQLEAYKAYLVKAGYDGSVREEAGKVRLSVTGKAAHASRPADGINATVRLLEVIARVSADSLADKLYHCFSDAYGRGAGLDCDIEPMGKLTINLGVLKIKDKALTAEVDCRYPYGMSSEILTEKLESTLKPLMVDKRYDDRPTLADCHSPYLKVLLDTYRELRHEPFAEPVISAGVSYSKVFANCVAFGPSAEGDVVLADQANENIEISKLLELFEIYATALVRLANLE
ncbi:MAG: Sapep family Mn(2+)-dependent dipeptidase [Clostridia bacterium]|nr:Sapep family Mn(2+)-dependent dipeptidase [Clostridia bacterium]